MSPSFMTSAVSHQTSPERENSDHGQYDADRHPERSFRIFRDFSHHVEAFLPAMSHAASDAAYASQRLNVPRACRKISRTMASRQFFQSRRRGLQATCHGSCSEAMGFRRLMPGLGSAAATEGTAK
jgi:hypothetical protein